VAARRLSSYDGETVRFWLKDAKTERRPAEDCSADEFFCGGPQAQVHLGEIQDRTPNSSARVSRILQDLFAFVFNTMIGKRSKRAQTQVLSSAILAGRLM
jgi:hypothetical protein